MRYESLDCRDMLRRSRTPMCHSNSEILLLKRCRFRIPVLIEDSMVASRTSRKSGDTVAIMRIMVMVKVLLQSVSAEGYRRMNLHHPCSK
jgi:hypothetical protein